MLVGLKDFPIVEAGDDLAKMIHEAAVKNNVTINQGDVVAIAQKIVSKAEGRIVRLNDVQPSPRSEKMAKAIQKDPRLVELVLRETKRIVKIAPKTLIVENKNGLICLNAGIDKSNVLGEDSYALLPEDPDRSAERIRAGILKLTGKHVAVIICDTYSRPFRRAQVEFAIGTAGINLFKDYRGQQDLFGYILQVKNVAIVDEIAAAAELIMGQGNEAIPVVIVKNLARVDGGRSALIADLWISREEDLFKNAH
ncbi:MAG: coenzyme F420-0:L-glutamate ligase [Candidatus Bathyarchaeota archaeon]|nr:MAG: coenzyme F420-0:L-glutamate ligase [Candidatus Bathyarchaeota archaeon]